MAYAWTNSTIVAGETPILSIHIKELRDAINAERARRPLGPGRYPFSGWPTENNGTITDGMMNQVLDAFRFATNYGSVTATAEIRKELIETLRAKVTALGQAPYYNGYYDCNGTCLGMCSNCTGACTGSCSGSCTGGCRDHCNSSCSGHCSGCSWAW